VLASNPLLADQGVAHQRLFLYRPGVALVVVDRARGPDVHSFQRRIQLAPGVGATADGDGVLGLEAPGFAGAVFDTGSDAALALAEGAEDPLAGYMAADYREWEPRTTVELTNEGSGLLRALTLALDDRVTHATGARWRGDEAAVRIAATNGRSTVEVAREGSALTISEPG
jgi:hypothetical protein